MRSRWPRLHRARPSAARGGCGGAGPASSSAPREEVGGGRVALERRGAERAEALDVVVEPRVGEVARRQVERPLEQPHEDRGLRPTQQRPSPRRAGRGSRPRARRTGPRRPTPSAARSALRRPVLEQRGSRGTGRTARAPTSCPPERWTTSRARSKRVETSVLAWATISARVSGGRAASSAGERMAAGSKPALRMRSAQNGTVSRACTRSARRRANDSSRWRSPGRRLNAGTLRACSGRRLAAHAGHEGLHDAAAQGGEDVGGRRAPHRAPAAGASPAVTSTGASGGAAEGRGARQPAQVAEAEARVDRREREGNERSEGQGPRARGRRAPRRASASSA